MSIAELFDRLEFIVHPNKSVLLSTQEIIILGFVINSRKISVKLTPQKKKKESKKISKLGILYENLIIRFFAKEIGTIFSVFPAVKYPPLH